MGEEGGGKTVGRWQRVLLREISPISSHSMETFHLVKTEIWFQGSEGNLWWSKEQKKKKERKLLSHSSLSSFSPPPLLDKISFQVLLSMNQADGPDDYLLLPKEMLPACVKPLTSSIKVTLPALCSHTPGREHGFMAQSILLRVIHYTQGRAAEGNCSRRALG